MVFIQRCQLLAHLILFQTCVCIKKFIRINLNVCLCNFFLTNIIYSDICLCNFSYKYILTFVCVEMFTNVTLHALYSSSCISMANQISNEHAARRQNRSSDDLSCSETSSLLSTMCSGEASGGEQNVSNIQMLTRTFRNVYAPNRVKPVKLVLICELCEMLKYGQCSASFFLKHSIHVDYFVLLSTVP